MTRRRIAATLDGHHWPQPRALLPLVERRAFRADTRRGFSFAPSPRWICLQCGIEARSPDLLCEPQQIEVTWVSARTSRAFRCSCQIADEVSEVCAARHHCIERAPGSTLGAIPTGRGYPDPQ